MSSTSRVPRWTGALGTLWLSRVASISDTDIRWEAEKLGKLTDALATLWPCCPFLPSFVAVCSCMGLREEMGDYSDPLSKKVVSFQHLWSSVGHCKLCRYIMLYVQLIGVLGIGSGPHWGGRAASMERSNDPVSSPSRIRPSFQEVDF